MRLVQRDPALHERLERLAREARVVIVAGLPGTGKSLVIHQLAHVGVNAGRAVHLLQWDVARTVLEASAAGQRHPVVDGITQPIIRKAVGLWARRAVAAWDQTSAASHLLIGEAPLVGGRLVELAQRQEDEAESLLADAACRFVIAVPSVVVRRHVEAERERRAVAARHPREREDAPPHVLRELWTEVVVAAWALGILARGDDVTYDPLVYRRVYETVLRHRRPEALGLDTILPTGAISVYEFAVPVTDVVPAEDDADAFVRDVETQYPDRALLARAVERWWDA
jgi:hypothetical protein